jgi:hypothetical protein
MTGSQPTLSNELAPTRPVALKKSRREMAQTDGLTRTIRAPFPGEMMLFSFEERFFCILESPKKRN